jgi:hypothetical protein
LSDFGVSNFSLTQGDFTWQAVVVR